MRVESSTGLDVSVFEAVLACGKVEARVALARQLASLLADREAPSMEREQVLPVLLKLAADEDASVRHALAAELVSVEGLHGDLLFAIVADDDAIAIPFLKQTPSLSGWHMMAVLRVGDDGRQRAVAGRHDIAAEARAYILKAGRIPAVSALLANSSQTFKPEELRSIYARLGQSGEVTEMLLAQPNVPADVRILQARKTAVRMRQLMAERNWLAANDAADLVADSEDAAILKVVAACQGYEQQAAVTFLAQSNMLTPSLILHAACLGDIVPVAAFLSHLTGQTAPRITDFIMGRGGAGIRSLLARSGLPAPCHGLIAAAADVAAEFHNLGVTPDADGFGRRLLEMLMMQFGAMPMQEQARLIEFVCRFADPKVRKIARQLKIDMLRAA